MPAATEQTLLDELDRRQDDVLAQLDELNLRLETLLQECTTSRGCDAEAAEY